MMVCSYFFRCRNGTAGLSSGQLLLRKQREVSYASILRAAYAQGMVAKARSLYRDPLAGLNLLRSSFDDFFRQVVLRNGAKDQLNTKQSTYMS